jgi:hypothetical protein
MTTKSERVKQLWRDPVYRSHQIAGRILGPPNKLDDTQKTKINCGFCNCEFLVLPSRVGITKFCSKECRVEARRGCPNLKNRGKIPSQRAGSGISGTYHGKLFRSLYELSFMINVVEKNNIIVEYESLKIPLGDGHVYIPDFVSHTEKIIYEIKYEKALSQPSIIKKISVATEYAAKIGYKFEVYTEKCMDVITLHNICLLVETGDVVLHKKKNGGIRYRALMKSVEEHLR